MDIETKKFRLDQLKTMFALNKEAHENGFISDEQYSKLLIMLNNTISEL